jgi:hypothetical protein
MRLDLLTGKSGSDKKESPRISLTINYMLLTGFPQSTISLCNPLTYLKYLYVLHTAQCPTLCASCL